MNQTKKMIQKEEFIALAVNKYIMQTAKVPINNDKSLNWKLLLTSDTKGEYLSTKFDKTNPFTGKEIVAKFDDNNNLYIYGILEKDSDYNAKNNYLYNFYTNKIFRVNTQAPKDKSKENLLKGSQVLYQKYVKDVVNQLSQNKEVRVVGDNCPTGAYFYELKNKELTFKYCKTSDYSFDVYQKEPIYVEDINDLAYIKAEIGSKAYAQKNGSWYEYYYQGDVASAWIPVASGSALNSQDEEADIEDRIISYIPNSKDISLRSDGGCMLANGDIFCWGSNFNKKAGISSKGQLDPSLSPDYINTPVMLKVQIDNTKKITDDSGKEYTRRDKRWYNNPYRVKFEKKAFNKTNVCGISPIFDYFQSGEYKKFGGDLYCNGFLNSKYFKDINPKELTSYFPGETESEILSDLKLLYGESFVLMADNSYDIKTPVLIKNKFFAQFKADEKDDSDQDEVYLTNVVMVDGVIAVLSQSGKIYTSGINDKGSLGIDNKDESFTQTTPIAINTSDQIFKEIFALRDIKCFGAIDENNQFWIWGERPNGEILYKPTKISERLYDPNAIFVNGKDFVLRGIDKSYYRTYETSSTKKLAVPATALSVALSGNSTSDEYLYVDIKCTKFDFGWGSAPDPAGGAYSAPPDPLAEIGRASCRERVCMFV